MYRQILLAGLMVLVASCASLSEEELSRDAGAGRSPTIDKQLNALHFDIVRLVEQATCNADVQCRTIPLGRKPCGGARFYMAYSMRDTDTTRLFELVNQYNELEKEREPDMREISDCRVIKDPGAQCVAQRCQIKPYKF